jgi:hypothetical protein
MYKIIIFICCLYGWKPWSLTLREECGLMVFVNRVLRRVLREEVTGIWSGCETFIMRSFIICTLYCMLTG